MSAEISFLAPELQRLDMLILQAEREYTLAAYSRAFAALEHLPQDDPAVIFRRAGITHAVAELRGDVEMLRRAIGEYELAWRSGVLPRDVARIMPDLIEECYEQLAEAEKHPFRA